MVPALPSTPFEEVRDFFYLRHNYIAELDEAAESHRAGDGLSDRTDGYRARGLSG